jgi:hypothetical protein
LGPGWLAHIRETGVYSALCRFPDYAEGFRRRRNWTVSGVLRFRLNPPDGTRSECLQFAACNSITGQALLRTPQLSASLGLATLETADTLGASRSAFLLNYVKQAKPRRAVIVAPKRLPSLFLGIIRNSA